MSEGGLAGLAYVLVALATVAALGRTLARLGMPLDRTLIWPLYIASHGRRGLEAQRAANAIRTEVDAAVSARLDEKRSEPLALRNRNRRPACFLPGKPDIAILRVTKWLPRHAHLTRAIGQCAVLDRIGGEFV